MINNESERWPRFCISGVSDLRSFSFFRPYIDAILPTLLVLITAVAAAGQSTGSPEDATANPVLRRIERARALGAVHQLQAPPPNWKTFVRQLTT